VANFFSGRAGNQSLGVVFLLPCHMVSPCAG
jgi:hypothetical protein